MSRKQFGFTRLRSKISKTVKKFKDVRQSNKIDIRLHDIIMSGLACMYYQEPSLLQFKGRMDNAAVRANVKAQFDVENIPSTTQLKDVLDDVSSKMFSSVFDVIHEEVDKAGILENFKNEKLGTYILGADGTQYFHSVKINCKHCLIKNHRKLPKDKHAKRYQEDDYNHPDTVCNNELKHASYSHMMLKGAIISSNSKAVLPLMPVNIVNESTGQNKKQSCEHAAFKQLLENHKSSYLKDIKITLTLDGLYADSVIINQIVSSNHNYIIVSKNSDNKYLHSKFEQLNEHQKHQFYIYENKKVNVYSYANNLKLNKDGTYDVNVNIVEFDSYTVNGDGTCELDYHGAWITNHETTNENVSEIVRCGRMRWAIENQIFNTMKNHGYDLEHSYGHGENNLSFNMALLTIIAFSFHQLLEIADEQYKQSRKEHGSKINFWDSCRMALKCMVFKTFEDLLDYLILIHNNNSPPEYKKELACAI